MKRLALLAALAVPLAAAASAQPARDAELVDAVLEAVQIEQLADAITGGISQGLPASAEEMFSVGALEDTLRAHLLADGRTGDLRDILAFLESSANQALMERGRQFVDEQAADPTWAATLMQRAQDPKKGAVADEALVRRFVRAQGTRERMPKMMRRLILAVADAVPEMAASLEADGGLDALMGEFDESTLGQMEDLQVATLRAAYVGLPDDVLVQASAFYESPAGRYFGDVTAEAAMDVMIPAFAVYMASVRSQVAERVVECAEWSGGECVQEIELGIVEADPDDLAPTRPDGPYEVAEVQPELVGGLAALQRTVVYPESARLGGAEGTVVVQFVVDEEGAVTQPEVIRSPDPRLSQAALDAVRQQRFTPGMDQGRPVKVRFALPIKFRLTGDEPEGDGGP